MPNWSKSQTSFEYFLTFFYYIFLFINSVRVFQANTEVEFDYVGITDVFGVNSYRLDEEQTLPFNVQTSHIVCIVFSTDSGTTREIEPASQVQISKV